MNAPNPALVTERAAKRLPRIALLLLCAAYVLPGVYGRDPWRNADVAAYGYMAGIAEGRSAWLAPTLGGLPADGDALPYWLGAASIEVLGRWLDPAVAARVPFALLMVLVLALTWYSTYHLARTQAAQPLPLAFGGEAKPVDYARAIADGAVLALIASLGLLQLGHETTPELAQLGAVALFVYALSAAPYGWRPRAAAVVALPALAASGAPAIAMALGAVGLLVGRTSSDSAARRFTAWVGAGLLVAVAVASALGAWGWRIGTAAMSFAGLWDIVRLTGWFTWPAWLLAIWTVWRWRRHLWFRHIAVPLGCFAVSLAACIGMGGSDRALLLGLPPLAVLAAFALPTLQRSAAAAIDWFSVCLFTIGAGVVWVIYLSMQTGVPAQPAINIARLSPGYANRFSGPALGAAALGTLAWLWLVRWRTGRNRHALWKSLVLPAGGVTLCLLLVMTLWLPPLDHARSSRALVRRIALRVPATGCVAAPGMPKSELAALEVFGRYRLDAATPLSQSTCTTLMRIERGLSRGSPLPGWLPLARERRNRNDDEVIAVYRWSGPPSSPLNH